MRRRARQISNVRKSECHVRVTCLPRVSPPHVANAVSRGRQRKCSAVTILRGGLDERSRGTRPERERCAPRATGDGSRASALQSRAPAREPSARRECAEQVSRGRERKCSAVTILRGGLDDRRREARVLNANGVLSRATDEGSIHGWRSMREHSHRLRAPVSAAHAPSTRNRLKGASENMGDIGTGDMGYTANGDSGRRRLTRFLRRASLGMRASNPKFRVFLRAVRRVSRSPSVRGPKQTRQHPSSSGSRPTS